MFRGVAYCKCLSPLQVFYHEYFMFQKCVQLYITFVQGFLSTPSDLTYHYLTFKLLQRLLVNILIKLGNWFTVCSRLPRKLLAEISLEC